MRLHIDFETRSTVDLRRAGVYRYAEDSNTDVIMACWAIEDEPVQTWLHTDPNPEDLFQALKDPKCIVVAHNAGFERAMLKYILGPRYGWPVPPFNRWDDTAARAARQSLPRSLDGASQAIGLHVTKDTEGQRLMMRMCRPRSINDDGTVVWWDDKERMDRLAQYCAQDVEVERALDQVLRPLTREEQEIWFLTELINDRGVSVNSDFAKTAITIANKAQLLLNEELNELSGGTVIAATNVAQFKEFLNQNGVNIFENTDDSLNKKAVDNLLKTNLSPTIRRALEIRRDGGKSSVAKYQAIVDRVSSDGRVRGNLMYHGASTGRWSGAGVQLQNLPRETVKDWPKAAKELTHDDPKALSVLSKMIRGTICAAPGARLIWADYAAIEARGVAWLAGQTDLVELFATGGKVYEEMAASIFRVPVAEIEKDSMERFLGKTVVLGCGYSMGPVKFRQTVAGMGSNIDEELAHHAVNTYRTKYSNIPRLWNRLNEATIAAIKTPKRETTYRQVSFYCDGDWLLIRLPSGRKLFYRNPRIVKYAGPFGERDTIEYMAVNSMTKKWGPERTFGGKLTENIVQGFCRDLIAGAMLDLENKNYPVVGSVHDEIICEVPNLSGSIDEMISIMCRVPDWAKGFPIAAEAKEGERYGK